MRSVHSFCSWLSGFLYQVTALPPSPYLVWIFRHAPRPSFESLNPELRLVYPSPPSCIVGAQVLDLSVAKGVIASSSPPAPLGRCFSAPAIAGKPCFAQSSSRAPFAWHLLTLWSPESDLPSPPVLLSRAVG